MSDTERTAPRDMNGQELIDALRAMAGDFRVVELGLKEPGVTYCWDRGNEISWFAADALERLDRVGDELAGKLVDADYEIRRLQKRNEEMRGTGR